MIRALHWFLTTIDRSSSALGTLFYGPPQYRVERSALLERCLLFGMVALLMAIGIVARW